MTISEVFTMVMPTEKSLRASLPYCHATGSPANPPNRSSNWQRNTTSVPRTNGAEFERGRLTGAMPTSAVAGRYL
jgi:hypothetical protein